MANQIYYNIFRFECYIRAIFYYPKYVVFDRPLISDISDVHKQNEIFRERLFVELKQEKGRAAPGIVMATAIFGLVTPWNFICGIFHLHSLTIWMIGWVLASIAALFINVKAYSPSKYLKDFKKREYKTRTIFNKAVLGAFLIVVGIWSIFILSSNYFLSHSII